MKARTLTGMDAALSDPALSTGARLTYYWLAHHCFGQKTTTVSQSTLGKLVGVHRTAIAEHTKALVVAKYIAEEASSGGDGRSSKKYRLLEIPQRVVGEPMSGEPTSGHPHTNDSKSTDHYASNSAKTLSNRDQVTRRRQTLRWEKPDVGEHTGAGGAGSPPQPAEGVTADRCRVSQHREEADPAKSLHKVAKQLRYEGGDEETILAALKARSDSMPEPLEESDLKRIAKKVCAWKKFDPMLIGERAA